MKLPRFSESLNNKVIVITGAGGVLCSTIAKGLALTGAKVMLLNRTYEKVLKIEKEICKDGGIAKAYACDVLNKDCLKAVHEQIKSEFGLCDILINGAGGNNSDAITDMEFYTEDQEGKSFFDLTEDGMNQVFGLNFMGTFLPCQEFVQDMIGNKDSSIINIASMSGYRSLTKVPAYSAAKAAIINFTEWLATHFSKVGIRANAIAPGFFIASQNERLLKNEDGSLTERGNKIIKNTPAQRFGESKELLGTIIFLASSEASGFINGVVIPIDGGFNAYSGV